MAVSFRQAWFLPSFLVMVMTLVRLLAPRIKGAIGEFRISSCLEELVGLGFYVLNDVDIGAGNVDHVVVGPTGVFAVETKAWSGRVYVAPGRRLKVGDRDEEGTRVQAVRGAMAIRRLVSETGFNGYVVAVVALPSTTLRRGKIGLRQADVVEAKDLCSFIKQRKEVLRRDEMDRIAMKLAPLVSQRRDVMVELEP